MFWAHKTWIFEFLDVSYIIDAIHITNLELLQIVTNLELLQKFSRY